MSCNGGMCSGFAPAPYELQVMQPGMVQPQVQVPQVQVPQYQAQVPQPVPVQTINTPPLTQPYIAPAPMALPGNQSYYGPYGYHPVYGHGAEEAKTKKNPWYDCLGLFQKK